MKNLCFWVAFLACGVAMGQRVTITDQMLINQSLRIGNSSAPVITRVVTDGTLTGVTNADLATAAAVKTYVDGLTSGLSSTYFPLVGGTFTGTTGNGFLGLPPQGSTPTAPASGIRMFANGASNLAFIRSNGHITTFDLSGSTGNRIFTYPANAGTFGILENAQTWTGATNTFNAVVGTTFTHNQPSQQTWGAINYDGTIFLKMSRNNGISSNPNNLTYDAYSAQYFNLQGSTKFELLQQTASFKFGNSPSFGMGDGLQVVGRLGVGTNSFFGSNPNVTPNGAISTQSLYVLNSYGDYQAGAAFQVSGTNRFSINAPVMTDAQVSALTGLTAGGWVYSSTQQRPYVYNGTSFYGVMMGPKTGIPSQRIALGGGDANLTSDANFTIGYNGSNPQLKMLGREVIEVGVSNGETTIGGGASVNNVRFTKDARFQGFVDNTIGVLQLRGNAGIQISSLSGGTMMNINNAYGINIDFNAPPPMPIDGSGALLRNSSDTYNNSTTATGGSVTNASVITFRGGSITSTNTGVSYGNASTLRIEDSPTAGTNSTFTNAWSLYVASGKSFFPRLVLTDNSYNNNSTNIQNNWNTSALSTVVQNTFAIIGQGRVTSNSSTAVGVYGNATTNAVASPTEIAVLGESTGNSNATGAGSLIGLYGAVRTNGTTSQTTIGVQSRIEPISTVGGGSQTPFSAAFYGTFAGRNNNGGTTMAGYYWGGFENVPSGSNTTVTNYNPLALNVGSGSGITNTWSYLDHAVHIGSTANTTAILELTSTTRGFLMPRATDAQIAAVTSPPLLLMMGSTTSERINVKRTDGFYQLAYVQDIKRDTVHKTVNANLDLSSLTTTWKNRCKRVTIETIVTAAATASNTITMPTPTADLVGIRFDVSVEDTSGDSDISVLSFGTDGVDGYLYNGDGTFSPSQNLYPGLGVYFGVYWCEAKGAYRWKLQ